MFDIMSQGFELSTFYKKKVEKLFEHLFFVPQLSKSSMSTSRTDETNNTIKNKNLIKIAKMVSSFYFNINV